METSAQVNTLNSGRSKTHTSVYFWGGGFPISCLIGSRGVYILVQIGALPNQEAVGIVSTVLILQQLVCSVGLYEHLTCCLHLKLRFWVGNTRERATRFALQWRKNGTSVLIDHCWLQLRCFFFFFCSILICIVQKMKLPMSLQSKFYSITTTIEVSALVHCLKQH